MIDAKTLVSWLPVKFLSYGKPTENLRQCIVIFCWLGSSFAPGVLKNAYLQRYFRLLTNASKDSHVFSAIDPLQKFEMEEPQKRS